LRVEALCAIRENGAAQPRPFAVMAAADDWEAPPHAVAAGHPLCLSAQATASPMGRLGAFPEKGVVQYRRHHAPSRNKYPPMSAGGQRAEQKAVLYSLLSSASLSPVKLPPAASSEIFLKYRSCPPGSVQSSMHAGVSPTFLKR